MWMSLGAEESFIYLICVIVPPMTQDWGDTREREGRVLLELPDQSREADNKQNKKDHSRLINFMKDINRGVSRRFWGRGAIMSECVVRKLS